MHGAEAIAAAGALTFSSVGERTVVRRAFSTSPLKLLNPQNHSHAAWVYLASYGGGLVGGDAVRIEIDVERGATGVISTQASTKVYRSPRGASQQLIADVADDAMLVLSPDPVVCFAQSSYEQNVDIRLAPRASLVLVDWLGAGRVASGERWRHDRFSSVTRIRCGVDCLLYDSLSLDPLDGDVAARMGRFNSLITIVIAGPRLAAEATRILQQVAEMPLEKSADLLVSASPLKNAALLLRIAAVSTERAGQTLRRFLAFLPLILGDDPWRRKW